MSRHLVGALVVASLAFAMDSVRAGTSAQPDMGPGLAPPVLRSIPLPPGKHAFGPLGPDAGLAPSFGGDGPATDDRSQAAEEKPVERNVPSRKEMLDTLFARLAKASDEGEAGGIAALIERLWMRSGSDTADLLMARALTAMGSDHRDIARDLLDRIVVLEPDWAEAWNRRATLRFLQNDDAGSMEDLSHVLALEPRHFGALSGLGFILQRNGLDKGALTALRKALEIYPENPDLRKAVDQLTPEVEGRDL